MCRRAVGGRQEQSAEAKVDVGGWNLGGAPLLPGEGVARSMWPSAKGTLDANAHLNSYEYSGVVSFLPRPETFAFRTEA